MDSLTHLVLGAAIGEAVLGKKIGKRGMLWGAFADTIPDFDVFASPFFPGAEGVLVHRGITHSLLFIAIASPVFGKMFSRFNFKRQAHWKDWTLLFFLGMITHVLIDAMTAYGTGLFEPFSHYRVSFDNIFVADPIYTLPLIISCIALMILKRDSPKRRAWNRFGLGLSTAYMLFTFVNKAYVSSVFEGSLQKQGISYSRCMTTPAPLNNFLWMAVAEDKDGFHVGYYSVFDKSKDMKFGYFLRNDSLFEAATDEKTKQNLRVFSNNYYSVSEKEGTIRFNDIRFGQMAGWDDPTAPFAFSYVLNDSTRAAPLDRGRMNVSIGEAFRSLLRRIKGI